MDRWKRPRDWSKANVIEEYLQVKLCMHHLMPLCHIFIDFHYQSLLKDDLFSDMSMKQFWKNITDDISKWFSFFYFMILMWYNPGYFFFCCVKRDLSSVMHLSSKIWLVCYMVWNWPYEISTLMEVRNFNDNTNQRTTRSNKNIMVPNKDRWTDFAHDCGSKCLF